MSPVAQTSALTQMRCKECNAPVNWIGVDERGKSYLHPCGHKAEFVAALVNRGDEIPEP